MILCNRDGMCLLRGTEWIFVYNSSKFSSLNLFSSVRNIQLMLHSHYHSETTLSWTNGQNLGTFQKSMLFRKTGNFGQDMYFHFFTSKRLISLNNG